MSFTLFAAAKTWIETVMSNTENHYDPKLDPKATADDVSAREEERIRLSVEGKPEEELPPELSVGDFTTDGAGSFYFETSIGNGKGSTVLKFSAAELPDIVKALSEPVVDLDKLPAAEVIRRTKARDPETGEVTFNLSGKKHSRTAIVPGDSWDAFLAYVAKLNDARLNAVAHYRNATAKAEAEAAEKLRKAEERKATGK